MVSVYSDRVIHGTSRRIASRGGARRHAWQSLWLVCCGCLAWPAGLLAASPMAATSSGAAREEAVRSIPWGSLTHQQRRAVQKVTGKSSLYRRLPTRVIECDPQIFTFLMQHPDVVADTWHVMGVSQLKVEPAGAQTFLAEDGLGTTGKFSYLESTWSETAFNRALIFARGSFEGKPLKQAIHANCVLLMRSGSYTETNGQVFVTVRLDTFIDFEQAGVDLVAKTVTPLVNKVADHNFNETLQFVSNFSRAAERNPDGLERFSQRLTKLEPATRDELVAVCRAAAARSAARLSQVQQELPALATHETPAITR